MIPQKSSPLPLEVSGPWDLKFVAREARNRRVRNMQLMERRKYDSGAPICNVQHPPKTLPFTPVVQFLQISKDKGRIL